MAEAGKEEEREDEEDKEEKKEKEKKKKKQRKVKMKKTVMQQEKQTLPNEIGTVARITTDFVTRRSHCCVLPLHLSPLLLFLRQC